MKESEAIQYLRNALVIAQKTRSIHAEAYSEVSERVRVFFEPKDTETRMAAETLTEDP